jgi:hypothetical protein
VFQDCGIDISMMDIDTIRMITITEKYLIDYANEMKVWMVGEHWGPLK